MHNGSIKIGILLVGFIAILLNSSCKKDPSLAPEVTTITLESLVPFYFPAANYYNAKNEIRKEGVHLGRKLFYDPILSGSNTISCASCHKQAFAFSDVGQATSMGENGFHGNRNSPAMFNLAWQPTYMWDGGITNIEIMPFAPITDGKEMNQDMKALVLELNNDSNYVQDFKNVFGEQGITETNFYYALAQFMSVMVSANAKYDKVQQGKELFTEQESEGYSLFKSNCNSCHTEPLFTNHGFENNGLELMSSDSGRGRVTALPGDMAKFKVPSLRNIELTYPYMHDGRINTLEKVIEHYSNDIVAHSNLSAKLPAGGLQLSTTEQNSIIAFLKTLTDYEFINNPELAAP